MVWEGSRESSSGRKLMAPVKSQYLLWTATMGPIINCRSPTYGWRGGASGNNWDTRRNFFLFGGRRVLWLGRARRRVGGL